MLPWWEGADEAQSRRSFSNPIGGDDSAPALLPAKLFPFEKLRVSISLGRIVSGDLGDPVTTQGRSSHRLMVVPREPARAEGHRLSESGGRHRFRACCYDRHEPAR